MVVAVLPLGFWKRLAFLKSQLLPQLAPPFLRNMTRVSSSCVE